MLIWEVTSYTQEHYFGYKIQGVALNTIFPKTLLEAGTILHRF